MKNRRGVATAVATAVLIVITACSSSGGGTPSGSPTSSSTSSPTSSATDSPTSATPSSAATDPSLVAASQAATFVPTYLAALDKLYSDPTVSINDIYKVAVQPESTNEALAIAKFRAASDRQSGSQKLVKISTSRVHLSGLGGTSANAEYPAVTLTACVDVSGVKVTDARGKAIGSASAPKYLIEGLTIVNIKYPSAGGWRVSNAPNKQAASCGA